MLVIKNRYVKLSFLVVGLITAVFLLGACSAKPNQQANQTGQTSGAEQQAGAEKTEVTLYFSDEQAMYLMPEKRQVTVRENNVGEAVVSELIKGPGSSSLKRTIPEDAKLLSLTVKEGIAYADFSKEIKNNNYGGSAGEIALIYSVVNSLAEVPGIESVQFLVEGAEVETLYGHMDTANPISPDQTLVKN